MNFRCFRNEKVYSLELINQHSEIKFQDVMNDKIILQEQTENSPLYKIKKISIYSDYFIKL